MKFTKRCKQIVTLLLIFSLTLTFTTTKVHSASIDINSLSSDDIKRLLDESDQTQTLEVSEFELLETMIENNEISEDKLSKDMIELSNLSIATLKEHGYSDFEISKIKNYNPEISPLNYARTMQEQLPEHVSLKFL